MIRRVTQEGLVGVDLTFHGDEAKLMCKRMTEKTVYELGLATEAQAKALVPVDSGRLRGSITTQGVGKGTDVSGKALASDKIASPGGDLDVYVGTNVPYAAYVEYGTKHSNAQPYLRPAYDMVLGRVVPITRENGKIEFAGYMQ